MAAPRRVIELAIGADDLSRLEVIARSRTEPASRVERARILLAYRSEPSSTAVGARIGVTHHTVQRCLRRAARLGVIAALLVAHVACLPSNSCSAITVTFDMLGLCKSAPGFAMAVPQ